MRTRAWSGRTICLVEVQQSVVWLTADATSVTTSAGRPVEQYHVEPLFFREPQRNGCTGAADGYRDRLGNGKTQFF
ncbi:hypothetical protein ACLKA7_001289, partial [Drosophila subpalustris]